MEGESPVPAQRPYAVCGSQLPSLTVDDTLPRRLSLASRLSHALTPLCAHVFAYPHAHVRPRSHAY